MARFLRCILLFSLPLMVGICALTLLPLDRRFAYTFIRGDCSGHGKWIHDRIYENPAPIDVAFIGTSATWAAIDDSTLTAEVSAQLGKHVEVTNLGYCRPGTTLHTLIIEELIAQKRPDHIVMEVRHAPPMGGHPMYGFVASSSQLLFPPTLLYQDYARDLFNGIALRWEMVRRAGRPEEPYSASHALHWYAKKHQTADADRMEELKDKRASRPILHEATLQESLIFHVHWMNLEHIARVCAHNGIRLSFLFINDYGSLMNEPRFHPRLKKLAPVWIPPYSILQEEAHYSDEGHLNMHGAQALVPFVSEKIVASWE